MEGQVYMLLIKTGDLWNRTFKRYWFVRKSIFWGAGVFIAAAWLPVTAIAASSTDDGKQSIFISGLTPDRRPAGAPTITKFQKTDGWYQQALKGIEKPYPASLRFLEDQGAWSVPFNQPGMPGRYDIRRLHKPAP